MGPRGAGCDLGLPSFQEAAITWHEVCPTARPALAWSACCQLAATWPDGGTRELPATVRQEALLREGNRQPWNMSAYTNAFVGSRQSSEIISSETLDLPARRKRFSSAGCAPRRAAVTIRHKEIRSKGGKEKDVEDFLQKMLYRIIVLLIVK